MRAWWQDLTDLVLPAECGGCGRPRAVLCPECRAALSGAAPRRVRPDPAPPGLPVVHAAAPYEDEVRATLLAHKERGALTLATPLGTALAGAVRAALGHPSLPHPHRRRTASDGPPSEGSGWPGSAGGRGPVLLVPVPSSRRAVRARGHDPARRIALAAAGEMRRTGAPVRVLAVLRQRRAVADQAGLDSRQRRHNLAGALEVATGGDRLLAGAGRVVLVDDLMTTGASLAEAARAVRVAVAGADAYGREAGEATEERIRRRAGKRMTEATTEGEDRNPAARGKTDAYEAGAMICAAVVAASPDGFEINRN
ncbi:ComF family protein [Streptomyces sp. NBC_01571]|uniref:ComF family protein n=1 Tax=Streptomyces sp. NBC_01571 TaxID=2975883 RepID=UPI00225AC4D7|nr:ComF family protein [Streptomyces sp. NBC_01571]MCX4575354.1 ComF family protein [Streptomyces sp. NBC_01571]